MSRAHRGNRSTEVRDAVEKEKSPSHVCLGCGSCYRKEVTLEKLVRESVRNPERFRKGVYARPEVLDALEAESKDKKND